MNQSESAKTQKALLVIDIQEDYTGTTARPPFPYKDSEQLIQTVNRAIEEAAHRDMLVVYIRQEFAGVLGKTLSKLFCGGTAIPGNPGTEIDKRINIINDNLFSKPVGDAFSNPKLQELLTKHQVGELYLTGLDAEFCVYETAKGALRHGYKVSIIEDAIVLKAENKWEAILKKYDRKGINLIRSEAIS